MCHGGWELGLITRLVTGGVGVSDGVGVCHLPESK